MSFGPAVVLAAAAPLSTRRCLVLAAFVLLALGCEDRQRPMPASTASAQPSATQPPPDLSAIPASHMTLESAAFEPGSAIPEKHTCEGRNISPPLSWTQAPELTKSFVLMLDDPDAPDPAAPKMVWNHWLVYGISGDTTELPEGAKLTKESQLGWNDYKHRRYEGPCPNKGRHRYVFKLYALDFFMRDLLDPDKPTIEERMKGRILAKAELMGTYEQQRK